MVHSGTLRKFVFMGCKSELVIITTGAFKSLYINVSDVFNIENDLEFFAQPYLFEQ